MTEPRHCDEYIEDHAAPEALRLFLRFKRMPATDQLRGDAPSLWATVKPAPTDKLEQFLRDHKVPPGTRVRVCMASRFGDVGINTDGAPHGYCARVPVEALTDFAVTREAPTPASPVVATDDMVEHGAKALYRFACDIDAGLPVWERSNPLTASLYRSKARAVLHAALNGGAS